VSSGDRQHRPPEATGGLSGAKRAAKLARDVDDPDIDAALDAVVAAAPPLPYEVRARLAWLLRGCRHDTRRDPAA
jgi:hypothetical protein